MNTKLIRKTFEFMIFLAVQLYAFGFLYFEMKYFIIENNFIGQYLRYIILLTIILCMLYTIDGYFTEKFK